MWAIPKIKEDWPDLDTLEPDDVLFHYDGPRLFTVHDRRGRLLLAYQCDEDDTIERFLVVPTSQRQLSDLRQNRIALRSALTNQGWAWLIDLDRQGQISSLGLVDPESLPNEVLPAQGVYLNRASSSVA